MLTRCCTKIVRDRLHLPAQPPTPAQPSIRLGNWYVPRHKRCRRQILVILRIAALAHNFDGLGSLGHGRRIDDDDQVLRPARQASSSASMSPSVSPCMCASCLSSPDSHCNRVAPRARPNFSRSYSTDRREVLRLSFVSVLASRPDAVTVASQYSSRLQRFSSPNTFSATISLPLGKRWPESE